MGPLTRRDNITTVQSTKLAQETKCQFPNEVWKYATSIFMILYSRPFDNSNASDNTQLLLADLD